MICAPRVGGFADFLDRARKIFFGVLRAFHLHEANGEFVRHEISV